MFINLDDYRDEKGDVDWKRYGDARLSNGEICSKCGRGIYGLADYGHTNLCYDCKAMSDDDDKVSHSSYIRCPKCGETMETGDWYEIMEDGEHEVYCDECNHKFTISTSIDISYTSPKRLKDKKI